IELALEAYRGGRFGSPAGLVGVERADAIHVGAHVAGRDDGGTDARDLAPEVEEAADNGDLGFVGDVIEAALPVGCARAGAGRPAQERRLEPLEEGGLAEEVEAYAEDVRGGEHVGEGPVGGGRGGDHHPLGHASGELSLDAPTGHPEESASDRVLDE